jgi:type I restriction enzyme S subunit
MQPGLKDGCQLIQLCKLSQSKKIRLPSDWQVNQLKDVVQINPETINGSYNQKEIQYIDISSIENYQIKKYERFSLGDRPSRAQRIVRKADMVVSTVRPYLRGFAKICDAQSNLVCSTGFAVLRPKTPEDLEFIFNYIKSNHFQVNIVRHMEGMAYPAVTSRIVGNSLVPWPSKIYERINIGRKLSKVDELIQKTDQVIEQTQRLKRGIMQRLLTKGIGHTTFKKTTIGEMPEKWKIVKLEEISKIKYGLSQPPEMDETGIPMIRATNVKNGTIHEHGLLRIKSSSIPKSKDVYLHHEDVIVVRSGAYTGDIGYIPRHLDGAIAGYDLIVTPNTQITDSIWLSNYLLSVKVQNYFSQLKSRVAQSHLNSQELSDTEILLPPLSEQQKITGIISNLDSYISIEQNQKLNQEHLKVALMQKLLTGKVRVKV